VPWTFLTVPDELLEYAERIIEHFSNLGYIIEIEPAEFEYPYTPTAACRRQQTTIFLEVDSTPRVDKLEEWAGYARSCSADTRIAMAVPPEALLSAKDEALLATLGIGLYGVLPGGIVERHPPKDQSVNVQLPRLDVLTPAQRQALGPAYEQFARSQWREGFEDACQSLEVEARKYLIREMQTGRIIFRTAKGTVRVITEEQVGKMPMGPLGNAFRDIETKTLADSQLGSALSAINKDRVGVAHHKADPSTEASLRLNVGQHMWKIVSALKNLLP
jgi:hypothetical protein